MKIILLIVMIVTVTQNVRMSSELQKVSPAHVMTDMMVMAGLVSTLTNAMTIVTAVQHFPIAIIR